MGRRIQDLPGELSRWEGEIPKRTRKLFGIIDMLMILIVIGFQECIDRSNLIRLYNLNMDSLL